MTGTYCGRFAPTPSGPLHLGSLVTAAASWLDARCHGGRWLLRIDDIDPPREQPGAADVIQRQLDRFGLEWDGATLFQSQRHACYEQALLTLLDESRAFHCALSRRDLADQGHRHPGPQTAVAPSPDTAVRLAVPDLEICFDDAVCGRQCLNLDREEGAFVIRRRDGLFAYQLACAVDDALLGITHVLRGDDLLASTFRQIHVMQCLGYSPPVYGHLPVIRDAQGEKLSKSTAAAALDESRPGEALSCALHHLGMVTNAAAPPAEQLVEAQAQWQSPFQGGGRDGQPLP